MTNQFQPRLRAALTTALLLVVLGGCREEKFAIGDLAPALAATDLAGEPASLDTWRGQPVFLTFWSDSCSSCIAVVHANVPRRISAVRRISGNRKIFAAALSAQGAGDHNGQGD